MMSSSLAREAYLAATSGAGEWQDDVKLYQPFQEQMVLPELAKCYGIETLLDLHKLGYEVIPRRNAEFISPSGKVPVLRADNRVLGEESILSFLQRKGLFSCKDLSDEKKLRTKALISVLETKLIPIELYACWIVQENIKQTLSLYGSVYVQPLKYFLSWKKQYSVKLCLEQTGWMSKNLEDVTNELTKTLDAFTVRLDESEFLVHDRPTEVDALLFGHLKAMLTTELSNNFVKRTLNKFPPLLRYYERLYKVLQDT